MRDKQVSDRLSELKIAKKDIKFIYLGEKYVQNCRKWLARAIRRHGKAIEREAFRDTYGDLRGYDDD